ncbi:YwmB family TATA-box binding protein [Pontibacillus marinus]|uniref:TATA-box binding protein n=1 Tax=Pontibacillus marinus BH030004 = DSM 16465 TaxID=1385511 RepID=A0A0A5G2H8_9BACI|nr:YwmB family TATA-box binding protein [Pontibacillus marinus]KGX87301.1 hypothetical protein N783_10225 [Pontibacillus marinus BH030004 = DSM 16465]
MKKLAIILWMMIMVQAQLFASAEADNAMPLQPLRDISDFLKQHEVPIESWEVIMKKQIHHEEIPSYVQKLQTQYPDFTLTKKEGKKSNKYILNRQKAGGISEQFIVIASKEVRPYAEVLYKASGESWNPDIRRDFSPRLLTIKAERFAENTTIFTCLTTKSSGKIDGVLLLEKFRSRLQIEKLQTLNENEFISNTGYTSHWNQALPYMDKGIMNVQYALRQDMGGKTTLTFGTPIITSEY